MQSFLHPGAAVAVRCDGYSASLTAPNGSAQRLLINSVRSPTHGTYHAKSALPLEAHGTGTALGDPVEVGAAVSVLS